MYRLGSVFALVFLCSSCHRNDHWQNQNIKTGNPSFDSAKLIYPATHYLHDLELEFLYTSHQLHSYINVYAEHIPPYQDDAKVARLSIDAGGRSHHFLVDRLAGGQRLKIPDDLLGTFIEILKKNPSVVLTLEGLYRTKVHTKEFKKHFETLHAKPFTFIPNDPITLAL